MIIGHEQAVVSLRSCTSPAMLLFGPASVGKYTTARHIAHEWGVRSCDLFCLQELTATGARSVSEQLARVRPFGKQRAFIIRLDGSSEQAQNILLKVLEEPLDGVRFFLIASQPPLPTILSRCVAFRFGLLSDSEVAEILVQTGMGREVAQQSALLGAGRVQPAAAGVSAQARGQVVSVLRALSAHDSGQLMHALRQWDSPAHELLAQWAAEAAAGRWRVFTEDSCSLGPNEARRLLGRLCTYSAAAPRLAAFAVLEPLCTR
jgi:replication-associated recombination protein RarA